MSTKYRVKSTQNYFFFISKAYEGLSYQVQAKFKGFPFWVSVTRKFNKLEDAEKYIQLIQKEYSNELVK